MNRKTYCFAVNVLILWAAYAGAAEIMVENASFERPQVDPNAFQALPYVAQWIEADNDAEYSANTGVFPNPGVASPGRLINAHGEQLAFLGSEQGNSLSQTLTAQYEPGYAYRLTVAVGVSGLFPPSEQNSLELAFYYMDGNEPVDLATKHLPAVGLSSTELVDVSLILPIVSSDVAWAGQGMGIAIRAVGPASGFWDLDHVRVEELIPLSLDVANASFEVPLVDPLAFPALPYALGWIELDNDTQNSTNTGVFPNPLTNTPGHLLYADSQQLAFLGSEEGNGFEQILGSAFRPGFSYQLTVGVGVSAMYAPSAENSLELVFYYVDHNEPVTLASQSVPASNYVSTELRDVTVTLDAVGPNDLWAGQSIGAAIRAVGPASGFWDLDHVRVSELVPSLPEIKNPSFEEPSIDPNIFPVLPFVNQWIELDQDAEGSTNTGVFMNTSIDSFDHVRNADGTQLAYLGSEQGNGLAQDLTVLYEPGHGYRLTVGVAVSSQYAPSPENSLEVVMYYNDGNEPVTIASDSISAEGLSSTQLVDVSVYVPTVQVDQAWAGQPISLALHAVGPAGGFWDLDHVRLGISHVEDDPKE